MHTLQIPLHKNASQLRGAVIAAAGIHKANHKPLLVLEVRLAWPSMQNTLHTARADKHSNCRTAHRAYTDYWTLGNSNHNGCRFLPSVRMDTSGANCTNAKHRRWTKKNVHYNAIGPASHSRKN